RRGFRAARRGSRRGRAAARGAARRARRRLRARRRRWQRGAVRGQAMPILGLSILAQIACAVHCVRNNRNSMWLMVIIFLSLPGCLAYAIFEILPGFTGRREVRLARATAVKRLDPEREVRRAREALEVADTAANRTALGDSLGEQGQWRAAAAEYHPATARAPGGG